jgi:hypothetical protein
LIHEELLLLAEHPGFDRDVAAHPALPREPVSLSHRVGFARHSYDETQRGNVTDGRTRMAGEAIYTCLCKKLWRTPIQTLQVLQMLQVLQKRLRIAEKTSLL